MKKILIVLILVFQTINLCSEELSEMYEQSAFFLTGKTYYREFYEYEKPIYYLIFISDAKCVLVQNTTFRVGQKNQSVKYCDYSYDYKNKTVVIGGKRGYVADKSIIMEDFIEVGITTIFLLY